MEFVREGHEVLSVQRLVTATQEVVVKRHHTFFAHLHLSPQITVDAGLDLVVPVSLVEWESGSAVVDMDRPVELFVNGVLVDTVPLVNGRGTATLQFSVPGTYRLTALADRAQDAEVEVTVT